MTDIDSSGIAPGRRALIRLGGDYEAAREAFEQELGLYDVSVGNELIRTGAPWKTVESRIEALDGRHGLMIMAHLNLGEIATLAGLLRSCALYLIGNPLVATRIVDLDIRGGLLVPFRVQLYEDGDGAMLTYDLPSASLAELRNGDIDVVGASLDGKMDAVVRAIKLRLGLTAP